MRHLRLFLSLILVSSTAIASEYKVAKITSDIKPNISYLVLETDSEGDITFMHQDEYTPDGTLEERETITTDQLRVGYVLLEESGFNVITIKSENFSAHNGGHVDITYLNNGLSKKYKTRVFELMAESEGWYLYDEFNRAIRRLNFKAKKVWGKVVGIDRIEATYR